MTPAQAITRHFNGDWYGTYGAFPTPGHGKADRGMTVKDADGGDVLLNSFNGGDWREVKDECRRLRLIPELARANDNCDRTLRIRDVGAWEYTDAAGVVLYRKVRMALPNGGKSYRFEHPDGRGGWRAKRGDAQQVPYRLPDILAAEHAAILYMAEGEKQADKLAAWGFLATSSKDWRRQFDNYVAGRTVVILPDNDAEGERVAAEAKAAVERVGGTAIMLNLPDLPPKGDVMDWAGSADELRALTDAALHPPVPMLRLLDPSAWHGAETPAREWALEEWIPARQATYLTGPGSAGKSLLSQLLCTCIAAGLPFMGVDTVPGVAIYLTCEDDPDELHRRQKAICAGLSLPLPALRGKLHLVSLVGEIGNELATFTPEGRMSAAPAFDRLRSTILATEAKFIVLDNVAHLFAGNENIRNQVAAFCGLLNGVAAEAGAAVLLIGHPNKTGAEYSGSTAWENQVRSRLFLETPKEGDGSVADRDARVLSRGKANYARNGETIEFRWHKGTFVRPDDLPRNIREELDATMQASAENAAFLRCLAKAGEEKRATSPNVTASNYAPRLFAGMTIGKAYSEKGFKAAMERLLHLGTIRNGERIYQRDNRSWATGLGLAQTLAQTPAQTLAQSCTEAEFPREEEVHKAARTHPPYTTYKTGGSREVAPPDFTDDDDFDPFEHPSACGGGA